MIDLRELSFDRNKVSDIQIALVNSGYLDPVFKVQSGPLDVPMTFTSSADGILGPETESAINIAMLDKPDIDIAIADIQSRNINFGGDKEEALVSFMRSKGYHLCEIPGAVNIVYIEGVDIEGWLPNANRMDEWNDVRIILMPVIKDAGLTWVIYHEAEATTAPGKHYTESPMNPAGAARISLGQHKAWWVGHHKSTQPALVQCAPIVISRDVNRDGSREDDDIMVAYSTLNQHSTRPGPIGTGVGKWSAGCLVGRFYEEHMLFMGAIYNDPRYSANPAHKFTTTIIDGNELMNA